MDRQGQDADKVISGREGYLFLAGDRNAVMDQHLGLRVMSGRVAGAWRRLFRHRRWTLPWTTRLYVQIVPDKHAVCHEYLPEGYRLAERRNVDIFIDATRSVLRHRLLYPLTELRTAGQAGIPVYHRMDTHWTDRGAVLAARALLDVIRGDIRNLPAPVEPSYVMREFRGDLADRRGACPAISAEFTVRPVGEILTLFDNGVRNTGRIRVLRHRTPPNDLTAVIFGASSTLNLLDTFSECFGTVVFCWSPNFDPAIIRHYRPKVVINQIRERFLMQPANDEYGLTTTEIAFIKSGLTRPLGDITPVAADPWRLLVNVLAKIGYPCNRRSQPYMMTLAHTLGLGPLYHRLISQTTPETPIKVSRSRVSAGLGHLLGLIGSSAGFDQGYVRAALATRGIEVDMPRLAQQFLLFGHLFGMRSSPAFDGQAYWRDNPDVAEAGLHPLVHLEKHGHGEDRQLPVPG